MHASQTSLSRFAGFAVLGLVLAGMSSCRKGTVASSFTPIATASFGADGCNSPNNTFAGPTLAYTNMAAIGATSQLAASLDEEVLFLSGADGSVLELDFTADPLLPTVTTIVAAGEIDTLLGAALTAPPAAVLSGIAVLDPSNLVVLEHTSNTILIVNRFNPMSVAFYIGFPNLTPSLVDGPGGAARFGFGPDPVQVIATGDGRLFVADGGNDVIREVSIGGLNAVRQVAGLGIPGSMDGSLNVAGFDAPSGLSVNCAGELLVTEGGATGNRVRVLRFGPDAFFGGVTGTAATLAGDGMAVSVEGVGELASVAAPVSPVTTAEGEIYWVDSATGILRRMVLSTGTVDCPMFADCATANMAGGAFSGAGNYSAAVTMSGRMYVLDGTAGTIQLVSP